jgi:hypothetical protein
MSMVFENYQLLELFDDYRLIEPEVEIAEFSSSYKHNLVLNLHVSPYDGYASLTLFDKESDKNIFDVGMEDLVRIDCKDGKLFFFKENNRYDPIITIQVKPYVSLLSFRL